MDGWDDEKQEGGDHLLMEDWGGLTFPGSDEEGGAHPQIMQMKQGFDAKQARLATNVSPVVKGRDSLGEIPREGGVVGGAEESG